MTGVNDIVQSQIQASAKSTETRLNQLEVGFNELRQRNAKFETWFQTFGQKVSDSETQLNGLAKTVSAQQGELAQIKTEVAKQAEHIQQSVHVAVSSMQTDLSSQLAQQFTEQSNRLEALLLKKQRQE